MLQLDSNNHTGFGKITSVPQIRPETLPLIGSAIILGRDIQLMDKIGQGSYSTFSIILQLHNAGIV